MRWPWSRPPTGPTPADEALQKSAEQLEEALERSHPTDRRQYLEEFAQRMREMRERNHLAEAVERALREGR
ncbi:DUF7620 family protein [Actinocorallia longicatena]|uniref:Uncharacterized protein n=1 Tax=Actinocorallia longicatena TaxID=111803 RepID=A0ABP6QF89_9ACTN